MTSVSLYYPSAPVHVGQTTFPLRSATLAGPVPGLAVGAPAGATGRPLQLLDGPPYANGAPHLGHVLNKHLKDALVRAWQVQGHPVTWRPGWDCHGLPVELAVERAGTPRTAGPAFLSAARTYAQTQVQGQAAVFQHQGWAAQWEVPWTTMDPRQEAATLRVLAQLLERGALDVRQAAVPWCPQCQSTVASAEQEDRPMDQESWVVPFDVVAPDGRRAVLLSWTTTPWTLPLHQGLALDPEADWVCLVQPGGAQAWVSAATAERWAAVFGAQVLPGTQKAAVWVNGVSQTPWGTGQVVAWPQASADAGTGALHAVAGLAQADTQLGQAHGWPVHAYLDAAGVLARSACAAQVGCVASLAASAPASEPVRAAYVGNPWWHVQRKQVAAPHCWRHKTPLLTRPSRQVFLALTPAMRAQVQTWVETLDFTPETARARLQAATRDRPDWCLSRQRTWGVPLALFLDKATGQPHPRAATWMRRVADAVAQEGVEAWWRHPSETWVGDDADLAALDRVDDVLDVWFDSGCVPQVLGPADAVVEGTDQHRGWFQACLWVAAALEAPCPFARVVCHGFVVDAAGAKLSKSTGGDTPTRPGAALKAWFDYPTDLVRLWALAGSAGADKAWSQASVEQASAAVARLRGLVRFLLANATPGSVPSDPAQVPVWDRYWWDRTTAQVQAAVARAALGDPGAGLASLLPFAEVFSAVALGSWKDRLYCADPASLERQTLGAVAWQCLAAWLPALAVFTPRLAQEALAGGAPATAHPPLPLTDAERAQVEVVLAARRAAAPHAEHWASQKVGPGKQVMGRQVEWPVWPGQLLADALGVAHLDAGPPGVRPSPYPVCPRCRRAQPGDPARGWGCVPCVVRTGVEDSGKGA